MQLDENKYKDWLMAQKVKFTISEWERPNIRTVLIKCLS